jgi:hypothetical protein
VWEEAGLRGVLINDLQHQYDYRKGGWKYRVWVYRMDVTDVADVWPEAAFRHRLFVELDTIHQFVAQPEILGAIAKLLRLPTGASPMTYPLPVASRESA